jgi:hypothetical protein
MRGSSRIRLSKGVIESILALTMVSLLAACGASTVKGSSNSLGATGASTDSAGCASDFEFVFNHTDVIAGHTRDVFLVLNDGAGPCTVKGYPIVTVPDSTITVTPTTSSDTWSNIAIQPITFASENSATFTPTPNDLDFFALQGRDDTTNCKLVSPSIALAKGITGSLTSVITVCGGELFVSPVVAGSAVFNP